MGGEYQSAKGLMEFEKALTESVLHPDGDNKIVFQIQNYPYRCFEREGYTVCLGLNVLTYVRGYAVSFWIGADITSSKKTIRMYFSDVCNNETHIETLEKHRSWEYADHVNVTDGFQLVMKDEHKQKVFSTASNAKSLLTEFINEPIKILLEQKVT
jgi:hypothetical protein